MKYRIKETGAIITQHEGALYHTEQNGSVYVTSLRDLGLTLEEIKPQENKLYAYKFKPSTEFEVRFFNVETKLPSLERAPEFDIDYTKRKIPKFEISRGETVQENFARYVQQCDKFLNGEL